MPSYGRPAVYITESLPTSRGIPSPSTSVAAFIGEHFRGPTTPVLCKSWGDFVTNFGGFPPAVPVLTNPNLAWSVYNFFNNGGQQAWISRIVSAGGSPVAASHTFNDGAGSPQPTLSLTALNVGTWGNALYGEIIARGTGTGRFDINIYLGGTGLTNLVETWKDLSINPTDARYAVNMINSPVAGSLYVAAVNLNSTTAAPNNAPAAIAPTQFTAGVDPTSPTSTERQNAVTVGTSPLDQVGGLLNLNMPGETTVGVLNAAITYAQARGNVFVAIDTPSGQTPAQAVSFLQSLNASSYFGVYYPWLNGNDPSLSTPQATRLQPPGGYVLGEIAQNDARRGVWHAPAGTNTVLSNVYSAERKLANSDLDTLTQANVNAIKTTRNGIVVWGTRTGILSVPLIYIPVRRTLNYIEDALKEGLQWTVFEPNAAPLWATITQIVSAFLSGIRQLGGLAGSTDADAFFVTCDPSVNTPTTISQGVVNVLVGVALLNPAEFISILIGQWQGGSSAQIAA